MIFSFLSSSSQRPPVFPMIFSEDDSMLSLTLGEMQTRITKLVEATARRHFEDIADPGALSHVTRPLRTQFEKLLQLAKTKQITSDLKKFPDWKKLQENIQWLVDQRNRLYNPLQEDQEAEESPHDS